MSATAGETADRGLAAVFALVATAAFVLRGAKAFLAAVRPLRVAAAFFPAALSLRVLAAFLAAARGFRVFFERDRRIRFTDLSFSS